MASVIYISRINLKAYYICIICVNNLQFVIASLFIKHCPQFNLHSLRKLIIFVFHTVFTLRKSKHDNFLKYSIAYIYVEYKQIWNRSTLIYSSINVSALQTNPHPSIYYTHKYISAHHRIHSNKTSTPTHVRHPTNLFTTTTLE
jgi:hypothetical protein